jgi:glutamyl-tRNA synthetase
MIRVRFAPSPTGFLHIGGLRTALYNFLFAKKYKGKFILRIEDTDIKRKVEGATENLIQILQKFNLNWDEGVYLTLKKGKIEIKQKGKYGPYIQSQRLEIYQKFAKKLVEKHLAYYCFCSKEDLEKMRKEQRAKKLPPMYDGRCRKLTKSEIKKRLLKGLPHVIRLKVPDEGSIEFNDLIRGKIKFDFKNIDDQVLLKSDGYPTYHLAVVVDDHLMRITHVIRGEEWLPSVPKHLLIYKAFNWKIPEFAHLPLILNPDRSKLSKRKSDVAVESYLEKGYLPEAILNFVALLGWNPDTDQEIFSLEELIKEFSLEKVQRSGAVFNLEKLDWMNGYYIRKMKIDELAVRCIPYLIQSGLIKSLKSKAKIPRFQIRKTKEIIDLDWLKKIVALEQIRMKKLTDLKELANFFFEEKLDYDPKILFWKGMEKDKVINILNLVKQKLKELPKEMFKREKIFDLLKELAKDYGTGEVFWPFRVALSGKTASPPPNEIAEILGKEKTLKRIEEAIKLLSHEK